MNQKYKAIRICAEAYKLLKMESEKTGVPMSTILKLSVEKWIKSNEYRKRVNG